MDVLSLWQAVTPSHSSMGHNAAAGADLGKKLIEAAKLGLDDEVRDLMGKGAPFTTDWLGTSPLHYAAQNGHVNTTHLLMRAGMSMDARTKVDKTPLHLAAQRGQKDTVLTLIKIGANVNAQDMLKMTPLHWAVEEQHLDVVVILVESKADISIKSKFDKKPLDIAVDKGNALIAHYLENEEKKIGKMSNKLLKNKSSMPLQVIAPKPELVASNIPTNTDLARLAALVGMQISSVPTMGSSEALSWLQSEMINTSSNNNNNAVSLESANSISLTEGGRLALQACNKLNNNSLEDLSKDSISLKDERESFPRVSPSTTSSSDLVKSTSSSQFISILVNGQVINIPASQLLIQPSHPNPFIAAGSIKQQLGQEEPFVKKRRLEKNPNSLVVSDVLMHNTTSPDNYINSMLVGSESVETENSCSGNEDEVLDLERDILQKQLEKAKREAKQCREELKKKEMEAEICKRRLALLNKNKS